MTGLLWYDWSKKQSIEQVIKDAAKRYEQRFGCAPTLAYINEGANVPAISNIQVVKRRDVRPHHVWVTNDG